MSAGGERRRRSPRTGGAGPRRVLVTGASRGIGRGIALALAGEGFDLALAYHRRADAAKEVAEAARALGVRATTLGFDVADRAACAAAIEADLEDGGAYWGAVHNAGVHADAPLPGMSGEAWDRVLRTNLDGFYNVMRPLLMPMVRLHRGGRIVAITSLAGLTGQRGQANYAASKAGLVAASRSLAQELARRRITVNCVAPGWIDTEMLGDADREALAARVPLGRLGTPDDVAAAVVYLFSEGASYVTGQVLSVNGGIS